ncbi:hypothetical protein M2404_000512 [Rheinheimera pacifica]|uniref:hypothetical protein n=1 Tax=Rheinheimera pacifica TaxID=173990 RepID=UPI002166F8ED|nr:hypothetical protein [Rheinheimera pacifica]MCS4306199.1 hypothetical protein [Rheinheimera pacifica]
MHTKYCALYLCLGLAAQPVAAEPQRVEQVLADTAQIDGQCCIEQLISRAITDFEQRARADWSYRVSRYENEEGEISSSIELFDPTRALSQQWTLLSVNGQPPNNKQLRKFAEKKLAETKQKQTENSGQQSFSVKLRDLIQIDTLQLLSSEPQRFQAGFAVYLSQLGAEASQHLKGSLIFDKQQHYIESIEITNTASFSPLFSADIKEFKLTLSFIKIDTAILPARQELTMKGRFAFFTTIDEVSTATYSDYRYVGP